MRKACLLLLVLGCAPKSPEVSVPTAKVERQKFARIIETEGILRAVKSTPVSVPPEAEWPLRITWLAADGSILKKGDPVARFDDLELKEKLANAESEKQVALAKKHKETVLLDAARRDRVRAAEAARRELSMTQTFQRRDTAIFARDQIIEGEIDERLQTVKVEHARNSQSVDQRLGRSKIGLIEVEHKKAQAAIARSEKGLRGLEIRAPHDGIFTLKRTWMGESFRVGDTVFRSMTVAEVSLVDEMEAEVFVVEAEAAGLGKGKQAEVVVDSQPEKPLKGTVKQVETVAKRRNPKSPTQYFGVILALDKKGSAGMNPGQRVRARLFLHEETALVVPRPAIFNRDGGWTAYRRESGGAFAPVVVKLGPSTAGLVTITSGLGAGDIVALRDPGKAVDELLPAAGKARGGKP